MLKLMSHQRAANTYEGSVLSLIYTFAFLADTFLPEQHPKKPHIDIGFMMIALAGSRGYCRFLNVILFVSVTNTHCL